MPSDGDTTLIIWLQTDPYIDDTDVNVSLVNFNYEAWVAEYRSLFGRYVNNSGDHDITSISNINLTINPVHSTDTPTYNLNVFGNAFRITVPSLADLNPGTEYTWSINADITHNTIEYGVVARNYDTTLQVLLGGITLAPPMVFNTYIFKPPVASGDDDGDGGGEHSSGEGGKNLMRTVRRLLVAASNKIYYEDD